MLLKRHDDDYTRQTRRVRATANCKIELNYKEITLVPFETSIISFVDLINVSQLVNID